MHTLIATIEPRSAFGGAIRGDTLFGQLCWAARHRWGGDRLTGLVENYTQGKPFLVVSDAFPEGHLPRPTLPLHRFAPVTHAERKRVKKLAWIPREAFAKPLEQWLRHARSDEEIAEQAVIQAHAQPHNTIHRLTGTTGRGEFAPYALPQSWFAPGLRLDVYIAYDPQRIEAGEVCTLLEDVGRYGYGRDASIGLGKFSVQPCPEADWPRQDQANGWLTLAPCAPQGLGLDPERSWYQPFTRFGRHGDLAVHTGRPFKTPLLLADAAALLGPRVYTETPFCGQGLGGEGQISKAIPETVHQGYAPVLPVHLENAA